MSFYQQNTISLYSWFLLVLSCNIFLMTFHGSIFLNIKLMPTTTSSPRRRGRGLHNPDSSHDQIRCFWLAEVRNFTNIMIEVSTIAHITGNHVYYLPSYSFCCHICAPRRAYSLMFLLTHVCATNPLLQDHRIVISTNTIRTVKLQSCRGRLYPSSQARCLRPYIMHRFITTS